MKNSYYLSNGVFLLALFALLFNDFYLKAYFHNALTGKLSDLSGLIVFVFFFTFLLGNRFKTVLFITTTLLFCWWKSALSSGFIDNWNELLPFYSIERVVDYTDFICLLILIPIYFYEPKVKQIFNKQWIGVPVLLLSVFAITATSKGGNLEAYGTTRKYIIQESFKLKMTHADFLKNLSLSNISFEKDPNAKPAEKPTDYHYYILRNFTIRDGLVVEAMFISVKERNKNLKLSIHSVSLIDPPVENPKAIKEAVVNEAKKLFALGD
jgi:chromate transport protein ChrA